MTLKEQVEQAGAERLAAYARLEEIAPAYRAISALYNKLHAQAERASAKWNSLDNELWRREYQESQVRQARIRKELEEQDRANNTLKTV